MRNVVKCCFLLCAFVSAGLDAADSVPRTKIQEDGITTVRSSLETTIVEVRVIQFTSRLPQPDQAEWEIKILFARHQCKSLETSQTPRRIVKTD